MAIRIVLADDHYLVREGLRRLLETEPEIEIAAACTDLESLLASVESERPDVVLTDIRMPPTRIDEGIQAAARLRETHPDVGVVVLSQYKDPGYALALLEDGTARRGYLLKERVDDIDQLVSAVKVVAAGGSVIDPKVVESLVAKKAGIEASPLNSLTPREREVLHEMAEGKNNAAIARALFLSERSVENVIRSLFQKLGIGFETTVHKRVKAEIVYLAARRLAERLRCRKRRGKACLSAMPSWRAQSDSTVHAHPLGSPRARTTRPVSPLVAWDASARRGVLARCHCQVRARFLFAHLRPSVRCNRSQQAVISESEEK